ncbi:hypothetical protein L1049_009234 [Liquidambar formosana]|uniref:DUF4283 domain-containing protein n=1 Tax=Liquidambar formosana TaxID=63359 RepID=A0AAP0SAX7_LIQFO
MERITVMKSINGSLSQQPIFDMMEPSLRCTSFTQKSNLRDASFSAYLKREEPNPDAQEHVGCTVDDCEISIFDAQKYFNESNEQKQGSKIVSPVHVNLDGIPEQSDLSAAPRLSTVSSVDGYSRNYRARSFHATPTASSEASWNSQTGLLSNPPGSLKVSLRNLPTSDGNKRGSSSSRWFFGRKCPCSGKKSVQVEEKFSEQKTPVRFTHINNSNVSKRQTPRSVENISVVEKAPNKMLEKSLGVTRDWAEGRREAIPNSQRFSLQDERSPSNLGQRVLASGRSFSDGNGFSFPILNPSSPMNLGLNILPPATVSPPSEDPPRDSLEVFQPPCDESIPRKSAELLRQRDRRNFTFPASPKSRMTTGTDDDVASDASSDLFEIESFSTQTTSYPMYHRRDSLDEDSGYSARRLVANSGSALYCGRSLDEPRTPSIAPTECYEPSEASIDWSVTTAEGFDRASVTNFSVTASEADEVIMIRHELGNRGGIGGGDVGGSKRRGNGLLSCRCEKAVSVGPHPVRCVPEGRLVGLPVPPFEEFSLLICKTAGLSCDDKSLDLEVDIENALNATNLSLVGKLITNRAVSLNTVRVVASKAWNFPGGLVITPLATNTFLFGFNKVNDRHRIFNLGPWSMVGADLVLKAWSPSLVLEEIDFTYSPFWLQIHGLHPDHKTIRNVEKIEAVLGKVVLVDFTSKEAMLWQNFLRVKVYIDVSKPFKFGFSLIRGNHPKEFRPWMRADHGNFLGMNLMGKNLTSRGSNPRHFSSGSQSPPMREARALHLNTPTIPHKPLDKSPFALVLPPALPPASTHFPLITDTTALTPLNKSPPIDISTDSIPPPSNHAVP